MATVVKKVLNPKTPEGQLLGAFATAQRFPGLRMFFVRVTRIFARGKIRKVSDIVKSKEAEDVVQKFNRPESTMYTKVLVPVGFPRLAIQGRRVMGFLTDTAQTTKQSISRIGKKPVKVPSKKITSALEQHIDFLKEESFFQKAHRAAKQQNLITRNERTREFYHDYAAEHGVNYRSMHMLRTGGRKIGDVKIGRMYFFRYEAEDTASGRGVRTKWTNNIESNRIYDEFPLIFLLSEDPGLLEGINFHYMMPKHRIILLGRMFEYLNNEDFDNRTKLFSVRFKRAIKENRRFRYAKAAYKEYKPGRIRSKILQVHPMDWELAITVPTERFVTPAGGRVASKTMWKQTNRLARKF